MDFLILYEKTIIGRVILNGETHQKIITRANELNYDLILRFKEFYGNSCEIAPSEFERFNTQLLEVCRYYYEKQEVDVCHFRMEIEALTNLGKKENLPILVRPD